MCALDTEKFSFHRFVRVVFLSDESSGKLALAFSIISAAASLNELGSLFPIPSAITNIN